MEWLGFDYSDAGLLRLVLACPGSVGISRNASPLRQFEPNAGNSRVLSSGAYESKKKLLFLLSQAVCSPSPCPPPHHFSFVSGLIHSRIVMLGKMIDSSWRSHFLKAYEMKQRDYVVYNAVYFEFRHSLDRYFLNTYYVLVIVGSTGDTTVQKGRQTHTSYCLVGSQALNESTK